MKKELIEVESINEKYSLVLKVDNQLMYPTDEEFKRLIKILTKTLEKI